MSLLAQAKADIQQITTNSDEFGKDIVFVGPYSEYAAVKGLHTKHHLGINSDGVQVHSKNAHISISESLLAAENYPVRNANGEVTLRGHKVTVKDSNGTDCTYVITEVFPNETIGLITCILSEYE